MIFEYETLKLIWFVLIGVLLLGFAVTGGFDLGVAALIPSLGKNDAERRLLLESIGPTWEGNQVWFITAAGALFAAWPLLYATIFSSLYLPFLLLLLALILRPPGIDFRSKLKSPLWRRTWDYSLFISGFLPIFLFGIAMGNILMGISFYFDNDLRSHPVGGFFSYIKIYTLICGLVSLCILLFHACLFIQSKTEGALSDKSRNSARSFALLFIISFSIAGYWTLNSIQGFEVVSSPSPGESFSPVLKKVITGQGLWAGNYQKYPLGYLIPAVSIGFVLLALLFSTLRRPFIALVSNAIAIAALLISIGFTLFPFILPSVSFPNHSLTIWDAVSSHLTLSWMFWATLLLLPIVLSYSSWAYWVMRGKVTLDENEQSGVY